MALCNYIPQIMLNNHKCIRIQQTVKKIGSVGLNECNGKMMEDPRHEHNVEIHNIVLSSQSISLNMYRGEKSLNILIDVIKVSLTGN